MPCLGYAHCTAYPAQVEAGPHGARVCGGCQGPWPGCATLHVPQELLKSLQCQELELECITSLGEEILATCHPDSIVTIKSWVTVAKSRFQEVGWWCQ